MATSSAISAYCDSLLQSGRFKDYCPNGLQIEGKNEVTRIVSGVTACQPLINAAIEEGADLLLVHHGYFWRGEDPRLTGIRRRRIAAFLEADLNLLAYHLPLDAHEIYGNNARLASVLGFDAPVCEDSKGLFWQTELPEARAAEDLLRHIQTCLGRMPQHIAGSDRPIRRLAWCTGAAQDLIEQAIEAGMDGFISGEISERTVHLAREAGLHYFSAGHHATERYGVQALGEHLAQKFDLQHQFIDVDNPV